MTDTAQPGPGPSSGPDPGPDPGPLTGIVDDLLDLCESELTSVGELVQTFGRAGFLPLMLIPALIVVSPLSGIPLLSTICGTIIFLVAMQMVLRRQHLWLPAILCRQKLSTRRLKDGVRRVRSTALWLDGHSHRRLPMLTEQPMTSLLQLACALCGGMMPFLELVPFSSSLLALTTCLLGLAMLTRDGLWAAVALLPLAAAAGVVIQLWT